MSELYSTLWTLEDGRNVPHGYHIVKCHMIFDIKMEDFPQKACLILTDI